MTKFVYVEGNDHNLCSMFSYFGWGLVKNPYLADLICLEGGVDVEPKLYGEGNTDSHTSFVKDITTLGLIKIAEMCNIPIVGICRGGQMLNVVHGGKMVQHIEGHTFKNHSIRVVSESGSSYTLEHKFKADHHQGIVPPKSLVHFPMGPIFWAPDGVCEGWINKDAKVFVYQPHPEWEDLGSPEQKIFMDYLAYIM